MLNIYRTHSRRATTAINKSWAASAMKGQAFRRALGITDAPLDEYRLVCRHNAPCRDHRPTLASSQNVRANFLVPRLGRGENLQVTWKGRPSRTRSSSFCKYFASEMEWTPVAEPVFVVLLQSLQTLPSSISVSYRAFLSPTYASDHDERDQTPHFGAAHHSS